MHPYVKEELDPHNKLFSLAGNSGSKVQTAESTPTRPLKVPVQSANGKTSEGSQKTKKSNHYPINEESMDELTTTLKKYKVMLQEAE